MNSKSSTLVETTSDFNPMTGGNKMKQLSLRQLAKQLGVSPAYLSQVRHGIRPASDKLLNLLNTLDTIPRLQVGCATIAPLGHSASNTI